MAIVDLFSGCGGFALGAHQAGLDVSTAIDLDPILSGSYAHNFPNTRHTIGDVSGLSGKVLKQLAGGHIHGLFGGPPCQGFSNIGRRDPEDPRRRLLNHFFRLVAECKPNFFVMENVEGLVRGEAHNALSSAMSLLPSDYQILGPIILDASEFGAATKRRRVFVIGTREAVCDPLLQSHLDVLKTPAPTVADAIKDLTDCERVDDDNGFDTWRLTKLAGVSKYASELRSESRKFTGHLATRHTPTVVERFRATPQGKVERVGRHHRLAWSGQCPTLRAGTGPENGSYQSVRPIHPTEPRVITVREAARLQGFPDAHRFHPTIWHSFRMIGNSVSPPVAKAVFTALSSVVP